MIQPVITFHGGGHGVRNRFSGTRKNPPVANDFSPPPGNYRAPHFRRNFRVTPWKSYSHSSGCALEFISGICNCSTEMICQQLRFQRTSIEISRVAPTTSNFGIPLNATESNDWISLLNFFQISSSRYPHTKVGKLDRSKLRFTNLCREQTRAKRSSREEASFQGVEVHLAYSRIHLFSPWHAAIAFMGAVKQVEGVRIEPRFEFLDQPLFMPFSPIFNPLR